MANRKPRFHDGWCFALVNGRLAEIYFRRQHGIYAYCYVDRQSFRTKRERLDIQHDIARYRFTFRNGWFRDKLNGYRFKLAAAQKVFGNTRKTIPLITLQKELGLARKMPKKSLQRKSVVRATQRAASPRDPRQAA